jgi:hypothetical protein
LPYENQPFNLPSDPLLYRRSGRGVGCVLWIMEVVLTKNQSIVLDQYNARRMWQY